MTWISVVPKILDVCVVTWENHPAGGKPPHSAKMQKKLTATFISTYCFDQAVGETDFSLLNSIFTW